jgi:ABC-type lipoprotein export system ATPase subunit
VSGTQVIDLIAQVHKEENQTVVMVTHEREYAMGCDRIMHMEGGVIVSVEQLT